MKTETLAKLMKLAKMQVDPKRSEIRGWIIKGFPNDWHDRYWMEKYQTVYFDEMAESLLERYDEGELDEEDEIFIEEMYSLAFEQNPPFYGFICDW